MTPYLTLVFIVLFSLSIRKWTQLRRRRYSIFRRLGIPYLEPHFILGSLKELKFTKNQNSIDVVSSCLEKFGPVFGLFTGSIPTIIIADVDIAHEILVKQFNKFINRPHLVVDAYPVTDTLVGLKNNRWREVRSLLLPTFSMLKMKKMSTTVNQKIDQMFSITEEQRKKNQNTEWYSTFQGLTLDTISESALALNTNCQREQGHNELLKSVRQFLKHAINPAIVIALIFPVFGKILTFISNTLSYSGRLNGMIISHLKKAISERLTLASQHNDILQLMLNSTSRKLDVNSNVVKKSSSAYLTENEVIANSWVFLLGGFETTSSALTYTTFLLAQNPDIQQNLFDEISSHCNNAGEHLTYEDIKCFTYLDHVIKESLRLFPPIVSFISREANEDTLIGDLFIPKGMNVQISVWDIHRDPIHWDNPNKFDPERFSKENVSKRHPMAYLPFGAGPRNCIGMKFAQLEAKLVLSRLILKYRFEIGKDTPETLKLTVPTVSINPEYNIYLQCIPRSTAGSSMDTS